MILSLEELEGIFQQKIAKINKKYVIFENGIKILHSKFKEVVPQETWSGWKFPSHINMRNIDLVIAASLNKLEGYSMPMSVDLNMSYFTNLTPIIDMVTSEKKMVSPGTWEVVEDSYDACMEVLPKELRKALIPVYFEYNPYILDKFRVETRAEGEKNIVNLYKCPPWRKFSAKYIGMPPEAEKFFHHLFPNEISRHYVYFWIKNAIVSRNETFLVLNGSKGIGKGILATIIKQLVGTENYSEAPKSLLKSDFNSVLRNKRVIFFDEFNITNGEQHDFLKKIANEYQTIERKGIDADTTEKIFNSYIIANNDATDMYVEWDDRRFSVVEMTDTDLRKVMSEKDILDFCTNKLLDDSYLYQLGSFILNFVPTEKFTTHSPLKTERFYDMAFNSLSIWQKFLVEKWESGTDQASLDSLKKDFENKNGKEIVFPANYVKVRDFLKNYRHRGTSTIGNIYKEPNSKKWFVDFRTTPEDIL